jgi:hypothetical protein
VIVRELDDVETRRTKRANDVLDRLERKYRASAKAETSELRLLRRPKPD